MEPCLWQTKKKGWKIPALRPSSLVFESPWRNTALKTSLGHCFLSLSFSLLSFYSFLNGAVLPRSGDKKACSWAGTSVWRLAMWVWLWNMESAKRFKLGQHPAVPSQFNTGNQKGPRELLLLPPHKTHSITQTHIGRWLYFALRFRHSNTAGRWLSFMGLQ